MHVLYVGVNIAVHLVTSSKAHHNILDSLTNKNVTVKIIEPQGNMSCVQTSQTVRLYHEDFLEIDEDDIVITSDVDAFPKSFKILEPIYSHRDKKIWLWQHAYSEKTGSTFPLCFVGMTKQLWRHIINPLAFTSLDNLMEWWLYKTLPSDGDNVLSKWFFDQRILSRAVLESHLCSTTKYELWNEVNLIARPFDDSKTCFHGGYSNTIDNGLDSSTWRHFLSYTNAGMLEHSASTILSSAPHYSIILASMSSSDDKKNSGTSGSYPNTTSSNLLKSDGNDLHIPEFDDTLHIKLGNVTVVTDSQNFSRAVGNESRQNILEKIDLAYLCQNNLKGIVVDVGGHFGDFGLLSASKHCKTAIFEPQIRRAQQIARSALLHHFESLVTVYNEAVTTKPFVKITASSEGVTKNNSSGESIDVIGDQLDKKFANETILFLRVDVEGFEVEVLGTASSLFKRKRIMHALFVYTPLHYMNRGSKDHQSFLPLLFDYGATSCYFLRRNQRGVVRIKMTNQLKRIKVQSDVYCSFLSSFSM